MSRNALAERVLSVLAAAVLIGGCASGSGASATSSQGPTAATQPSRGVASPTPAVVETDDITYGGTDALTKPELLDVYAPTRPGPWPVVVMLHGSPPSNTKVTLGTPAWHVAEQGFVVFVPSWGHLADGTPSGAPTTPQVRAIGAEGACAVAFARTHAAEYGGDPSKVIVFGHSAGANLAAGIGFAPATPTPGCRGGTSVGPIHALVTWDGDWTLSDPIWDEALDADPSLMDWTPLEQIASNRTLRVVMLMSYIVGPYVRDLSDPKAFEAFFRVRDPTGSLRRQLVTIGALDDKAYDLQEFQQLLYTLLKVQGNPVTLTVLPGASHDAMGADAMPTFVAAFREAAT